MAVSFSLLGQLRELHFHLENYEKWHFFAYFLHLKNKSTAIYIFQDQVFAVCLLDGQNSSFLMVHAVPKWHTQSLPERRKLYPITLLFVQVKANTIYFFLELDGSGILFEMKMSTFLSLWGDNDSADLFYGKHKLCCFIVFCSCVSVYVCCLSVSIFLCRKGPVQEQQKFCL